MRNPLCKAGKLLRAALRCRRGGAIIEMAFAFPVLMIALAGTIDYGRYYWTQNSMQLALEETSRYVMITGTTSQSSIQEYLRLKVQAAAIPNVTVAVTVDPSGTMSYATINASCSFNSIFADFLPALAARSITVKVKVPIIS